MISKFCVHCGIKTFDGGYASFGGADRWICSDVKMCAIRRRESKVCGKLALGCGPCQLLPGHSTMCHCSHYAMNGHMRHNEDLAASGWCECLDCAPSRRRRMGIRPLHV